jgi:uncharacterized protein involved in type VI secretion and phage assembly
MNEPQKFYGKYRGTVVTNVDPLRTGRLLVQCPDVLGLGISSWAMPCLPFGGLQSGMFTYPAIQSGVWLEFEQGDPDYPIWVGGYWGSAAEVPALAQSAPPGVHAFVIQTMLQNTLMISDTPGPTGGIIIKTTTGAMLSINDATGITISNAKGAIINLLGPAVTINGTALQIT